MTWLDRQTRREEQSWRERWGCDDHGDEVARRRMFRGDTLVFSVQVLKPDPAATGPNPPLIPAPVGGWKFWCTAKYQLPDPDQQAVFQLTSNPANGIVVTNANAGVLAVTVAPILTRSFPDSDVHLVYDVQAMDAFGVVSTVEVGVLTVRPDVTHAITG